jgi:(4S)-4-hydroxy-5-phosphonooxypentane-2,3-dione isomerase
MFAILFRVIAKPGKRKKLRDFLEWDSEYCKANEKKGTLRFDVLEDPENKDAFYVYEAYKNHAAFVTHQKNPPYLKWKSMKAESVVLYMELFKGNAMCSSASA